EMGGTGKGKLENADGKVNEKNIWGQKSPWCDYSGTLDGKVVGLAILDDPANNPTCCWHSRGYGLMAANPFGRDKSFPAMKGKTDLVKLAKGEHLKLRYGVLIHPGDAKDGKVADYYQRFVKLKDLFFSRPARRKAHVPRPRCRNRETDTASRSKRRPERGRRKCNRRSARRRGRRGGRRRTRPPIERPRQGSRWP